MIDFIYSDTYLRYVLGEGHPTNPERARNTLTFIQKAGIPHRLVEPRQATIDELATVHARDYIEHIRRGYDSEWTGHRPWLHDVAATIVGGTLDAAHRIVTGETVRAFNPMGAKHHAMLARAEGFCIYNDMAVAAHTLIEAGMRVLYIDWDAHHGNGVEFLLDTRPEVMTASIHNGYTYPGTGWYHRPEYKAYNWPLSSGAPGQEMLTALKEALQLALSFRPDVVLLAAGADGHMFDPLGDLSYTTADFTAAAHLVVEFAEQMCQGRILAGGAGGYRPNDYTPAVWREVVRVLAGAAGS